MDVVSFFAGCGGLDLGFEKAGFRVVWANELEQHCHATYRRNHPNTQLVIGDVCNIDPASIPECDGFIGGPPCQSWSIGGKQRGLEDKRGQLFVKYIELIKAKQPKFFVIENVKGMLDVKFRDVFDSFVISLDTAGYDVKWSLLDAVNYRIPQNRERVFFVGFRKDLQIDYRFPAPICHEPITLEKAIGDIIEKPNSVFGKISVAPSSADRIEAKHHNHDVVMTEMGSFYYRGNRRRGWNQPSFTINATADFAPLHPASPKMIYYGHENWHFQEERINEYRRMSVRECARIQTFPDNFIFEYENIKDAYRMIGNAVPPRLGLEIAKSILLAINYHSDSRTNNRISYIQKADSKQKETLVLVGYYKGEEHKRLILNNKLYYVRSDGRKGSIFKEDCSISPQFLLLHYKEKSEILELETQEPILLHASYLSSLGFKTSGLTYLGFEIRNSEPIVFKNSLGGIRKYIFEESNFSPYITTIEKILK